MGFLDELRMSNIFQPGALSGMFPPVERRQEMLPYQPIQTGLTQVQTPQPIQSPGLNRVANQVAQQPEQQPMNTVLGDYITPYQRESLDLERARIRQTGQLGSERLDIQQQAQTLNELKNKQIFDVKIAETERRVADSEAKLKLAYDQLAARQNDSKAQLDFKTAQQEAITAIHELEMTRKDAALAEQKRINDSLIAARNAAIEAGKGSTEKTSINPEGTERTVERRTGVPPSNNMVRPTNTPPTPAGVNKQPPNTTRMMGPDKNIYYVPDAKVNEYVKKHNMLFVDEKGKVK